MENFHFGENLKRLREQKKKSQEVMATDMEMSQGSLSKIEGESHVPHDDFVTGAANYLKISRRELLPPRWFIETIKRRVYVLTVTGHCFYILFIAGFFCSGIIDISNWSERSVLEKVILISAFLLGAIALYRFTVRRIEITEYEV